jgi:Ca-activated chloride channel homolog
MQTRFLAVLSVLTCSAGPSFRANVELVLVPVTVIDRKGAAVTGLERSHFTLTQDSIPQNIVSFAQQDVPCSVGVIVDTSGSMFHQLAAAKSVIRAFLETPATRFAQDPVAIQNSLQMVRPGGSTALVDTLYLALNKMHFAHNPRRALLVISDGTDNHSRYSKGDLMRMAMEADVQIYTISAVQEEQRGLTLLENLSEKTGGLHFMVAFSADAERVAKQVGQALRNQYLIGYRPVDLEATTGKWHKISVKLDVPNTNVYARNGYYSR